MVKPAAAGQSNSAAERRRRFALPRRDPKAPLSVTLQYRGGPEAWVEIRTRGAVWRYPGYVDIASVVLEINKAL
jgi:hypothetical protein